MTRKPPPFGYRYRSNESWDTTLVENPKIRRYFFRRGHINVAEFATNERGAMAQYGNCIGTYYITRKNS